MKQCQTNHNYCKMWSNKILIEKNLVYLKTRVLPSVSLSRNLDLRKKNFATTHRQSLQCTVNIVCMFAQSNKLTTVIGCKVTVLATVARRAWAVYHTEHPLLHVARNTWARGSASWGAICDSWCSSYSLCTKQVPISLTSRGGRT